MIQSRILKYALNIGSVLLLTSVVTDSYLWLAQQYLIPCWTIAGTSLGLILFLQAIKKVICK